MTRDILILLSQLKLDNILDVVGVGEHIHRLHGYHAVFTIQ